MKKISLNKDWDFYESDESMSFVFAKPEAEKVDLPHDFIRTKPRSAGAAGGAGNGFFGQGEGVYRKQLEDVQNWKGKTVLLDVDGAYMNSEISLSGELLAHHPYGYTPLLVELSDALRFDGKKNELKIIAQSRQPSSRWYSGGGLYRSVSLWVGEKICIRPWDLFITTPQVAEDKALVQTQVTVTSRREEGQEVTLCCRILDAEGRQAGEKVLTVWIPGTADGTVTRFGCRPAAEMTCCLKVSLPSPGLWEPESPYLYTCQILVKEGEKLLDTAETEFGVRTISVDAQNGFRLNGKAMKLKGGCLHHDNGLLGACAYPKAEERKIRLLKAAGYNAVRISHYPPSLAMLEACDRMGMLLLDECFDVWRLGKVPLDYHLYFEEWWERDLELMVRRDRNHPCVITYSTGNEIGERDGRNDGALWSARLSEKIRSLDSTRFILSAICGIFDEEADPGSNFEANILERGEDTWGEKTFGYAQPLDIVGYNYEYKRYERDHDTFPDRVICGTETHACNTWDYWQSVKRCPWVIGDFIWAAVDYLGEVGVGKVYWKSKGEPFQFMGSYPWRSSWQSDFMMTGERRPQSFYREIMWEHTQETFLFTTHPRHYGDEAYGSGWHWADVNADWSFGEEWRGKMTQVECYSPGDEVEFILNGKSLGRRKCDRLTARMDIPYEPGILEAVSFRRGEKISRAVLETAGPAAKISLIPETEQILADGEELCYIRIEIVDEKGRRLPSGSRKIRASLDGPARFLALGSGNPCTEDQIGDLECSVFQGSAQLILCATAAGRLEICVESEGLDAGFCQVQAVEPGQPARK